MKNVEIGHGSGGKMTRDLIEQIFLKYLSNDELSPLNDAALLNVNSRIAFTTDSYVVRPIFFPGGDIGKLSLCGTINDLVVSGAVPRYISAGFIIEEGFAFRDLGQIVKSMSNSARRAGINVVTGDTKVVDRGKGDGIYINTTGIGEIIKPLSLNDISAGDAVVITGTLGDHGTAVALARNEFDIIAPVESDCASLMELLLPLFETEGIKWMRDPTRGGMATVLAELAEATGLGVMVFDTRIPVREDVRFISDMLGYDPLYLANEGKAVIVTSGESADDIVNQLRQHPLGKDAAIIGNITSRFNGARLKTRIGGERVLDMLEEELLPRIC